LTDRAFSDIIGINTGNVTGIDAERIPNEVD
jgi:hypothetical protein